MPENRVSDVERRIETQEMVSKLLVERQEMMVLFCQVAGLEPYSPDEPANQRLSEFCQVLMDYMAFGHFEIYDRISRGEEKRADVIRVAEEVYAKLVEAADYAVAFNDKYDTSNKHESLDQDHLEQDLSILGEELAVRIEMEDRLVTAMQL